VEGEVFIQYEIEDAPRLIAARRYRTIHELEGAWEKTRFFPWFSCFGSNRRSLVRVPVRPSQETLIFCQHPLAQPNWGREFRHHAIGYTQNSLFSARSVPGT
jgi:hypothetical protein